MIAVFLAPAIILTTMFFVLPLLFIIFTSVTDWRVGSLSNAHFVGLDVYIQLFKDPDFWRTVWNTVVWILVTVLIHLPLALMAAMILSRKILGWKFFRTIYFLPNVIAQFSIALIWMFLYNANFGAINSFLKLIGLESLCRPWLNSPDTALGAVIVTWIFNVGFFMVIFMTQISTIPRSLYEAAETDGASVLQQELHITLPMVKESIFMVSMLSITNAFKTFDVPFSLTNGGPGVSSQIMPIMMYKQLLMDHGNVSNAIGVVMVVIGLLSVMLLKIISNRKERSSVR